MKVTKAFLLAAALLAGTCASAAQTLAEQTKLTGAKAIAKFPARLQDSDIASLKDAVWCEVMDGVEFFYGEFNKLYDTTANDVYYFKIDYQRAKVRMEFVENRRNGGSNKTTSYVANKNSALFGINCTFPQWYSKMDGTVVKDGNNDGGLALNDNKTFMFFKASWLRDNPTGEGYRDVFSTEAPGLYHGVQTLSGTTWGKAPYTFMGATKDGGTIYICVVDGRTSRSQGLGYGTVHDFLVELGCYDGMCLDGGGSTTMVCKKTLMPTGMTDRQHDSDGSANYFTLNNTSDGSERAVCNQLLFVACEAPELTAIAKPSAATGLIYDGTARVGVPAGDHYTISGNTATAAGSYQATVTPKWGFCWQGGSTDPVTVSWSIAKAPLTVKANDVSVVEGDTPNYTVAYSGFVGGEDSSALGGTLAFDCAYTTSTPGKTKLDVMPKGLTSDNYAITFAKGTLTVSFAAPTLSNVTATSIVYGQTLADSTVSATVTPTLAGTFVWDDASLSPKVADSGKTYGGVFRPTSEDYASVPFEVAVAVAKAPLTVKANDATVVYGNAAPSFSASCSGFVKGDTESVLKGTLGFDCAYTKTTKAGTTVDITPKGMTADNYEITFAKGMLTVDKRQLVVGGVTGSAITYGETLAASVPSGTVEPNVAGAFAWSDPGLAPCVADSGVTEYAGTFVPDDTENYLGTDFTATVTVNRKEISVPTARTDLVFNFSEQTGVDAGEGYALTGETATEVGEHVATASLTDKANTCWADGEQSVADKEIVWTIADSTPVFTGVAEAGTDWNGSDVAFDICDLNIGSHSIGDLLATFDVNGKTYEGLVTAQGTGAYRLSFQVDAEGANAVVAEQAYEGTYRLLLGDGVSAPVEVASGSQVLLQGRPSTDTNGWFRETAATCGQSGTWTRNGEAVVMETQGEHVVVESSSTDSFDFTPNRAMDANTKGVVEARILYDVPGEEDDAPPPDDVRCASRIVEDDETGAVKLQVYAALPDGNGGWNVAWHDWNTPETNGFSFVQGEEYVIRIVCDFETGTRGLVCSVRAADATDGAPLFTGYLTDVATGETTERISALGIFGIGKFSLFEGTYTRDYLDASLASVNGQKFASVADAVAAANGAAITLLHRASWRPATVEEEQSAVFVNPDWLVLLSAAPEIFGASRIGVCSWSWHDDMTSILARMKQGGFKGMQLALSPWIWDEGEATDAQKETFGDLEGDEVLALIKSEAEKTNIVIHATMICFADEDYTSTTTISNTCGLFYGLAPSATSERANAESKWTHRSNQFERAAILTGELGVPYLTAHLGLSGLDDASAGYPRLYWACKVCQQNGCKLLLETGMYSAEETAALLTKLVQTHPDIKDAVGLNFDSANQILYGTDNPTHAFPILRKWIDQVHIKDCVEDLALRGGWATDVEWGLGDVSTKYDFIAYLRENGFKGPLLVEHESGEATADARADEILTAVRALLVSNNADDPTCAAPDWIDPSLMEGDTPAEQSAAAMKAQGFDEPAVEAVAEAGEGAYETVSEWSQAWADGWQARGEPSKPMPADFARMPGVLTAAAIGAAEPLTEDAVKITSMEPSADGGVSIKVSLGEYQNLKDGNEALLKSALGVTGAYRLGSGAAFSADNVGVSAKEVNASEVELKATPKPVADKAPASFFFRATAR